MSNKTTLPGGDKNTAIGIEGNHFVYPSAEHKGWDSLTYPKRLPMVAGKVGALQNTDVKVRDLPFVINRQLTAAHRDGNLREELGRNLTFLEENQVADKGTLRILRDYEGSLLGLNGPDAEILDSVTGIISSLRPQE